MIVNNIIGWKEGSASRSITGEAIDIGRVFAIE
jgi:hypothetical protein